MAKRKKKSNKALWAIVVVLVLILMGVTCPSHEDHKQAVTKAVNEYANREVVHDDSPWTTLGALFVDGLVNALVEEVFSTQNYLVCSVGTITYMDGEKEHVSFGILGHVFTFDADDVAECVEKMGKGE